MAELETQQQTQVGRTEEGDFSWLLNKEFKPKSERAKEDVEAAVSTLAEFVLKGVATISDDTIKSIQSIIAEIDRKLTEQINLILHNEEFQKLESAWRGLHYLVNNTETDEMLKIRVMNISKKELAKTLKKFKGISWDQSPIFKRLYEEEFGQFGGEPFGCLVADYYFDHFAPDVELLSQIAQISAASHCPFLSAVSPTTLQMDSWNELANPRDLFHAYLMATKPTPLMSSALRKTRQARIAANTIGPIRLTRWQPTSTVRSSCTAGVRESEALNPAVPWKICRSMPSPPTTAEWT